MNENDFPLASVFNLAASSFPSWKKIRQRLQNSSRSFFLSRKFEKSLLSNHSMIHQYAMLCAACDWNFLTPIAALAEDHRQPVVRINSSKFKILRG
ncbi:MAG: hypothetical protein ACTFAL_00835 [Candidatus Electronema sp. V4]|uniref:hypothetical protein n=1 Tax=Candidatus Electronema sp. V4 TaxID=3454756 RepID=UPI0040558DF4